MSTVATHHDSPNDDGDADGEQEMNPTGSVEHECANGPDDDQRNPYKNAEIHELTGCAMAFKLPT